jgi:hypothetical protein
MPRRIDVESMYEEPKNLLCALFKDISLAQAEELK